MLQLFVELRSLLEYTPISIYALCIPPSRFLLVIFVVITMQTTAHYYHPLRCYNILLSTYVEVMTLKVKRVPSSQSKIADPVVVIHS